MGSLIAVYALGTSGALHVLYRFQGSSGRRVADVFRRVGLPILSRP